MIHVLLTSPSLRQPRLLLAGLIGHGFETLLVAGNSFIEPNPLGKIEKPIFVHAFLAVSQSLAVTGA
jgi:hypothetical protein